MSLGALWEGEVENPKSAIFAFPGPCLGLFDPKRLSSQMYKKFRRKHKSARALKMHIRGQVDAASRFCALSKCRNAYLSRFARKIRFCRIDREIILNMTQKRVLTRSILRAGHSSGPLRAQVASPRHAPTTRAFSGSELFGKGEIENPKSTIFDFPSTCSGKWQISTLSKSRPKWPERTF